MSVRCLGIELTDRCDLACSHCLRHVVPPNSTRARDIDFDLMRRMVGEAAALGIERIGLTGGEPMLHPRFLEIVDLIVDAQVPYHFLSNGLGLPRLIPRLVARPARRQLLQTICVSMEGASEETHDKIRGRGTFRRTLAGIAVLRAMGIPFLIQVSVGRVNRHEIEPMALLAHHLGATKISFAHFLPNGRLHATGNHDLTSRERHDVEAVIRRLIDAMRFPIGMGEGYYVPHADHQCGTVRQTTLNVDASGHVTFCCELSSFNGDSRSAESRPDFIMDLATSTLASAIERKSAAVARFRAARLDDESAGRHTEDDRFACRYCIRHFGKPDGGLVRMGRTRNPESNAAGVES